MEKHSIEWEKYPANWWIPGSEVEPLSQGALRKYLWGMNERIVFYEKVFQLLLAGLSNRDTPHLLSNLNPGPTWNQKALYDIGGRKPFEDKFRQLADAKMPLMKLNSVAKELTEIGAHLEKLILNETLKMMAK